MMFRPAAPADEAGLADLFFALAQAGDETLFHPHPLTQEAARTVCRHREAMLEGPHDEYHVAVDVCGTDSTETIVGYGLLRGWNEGFEIPSLGIAVHPDHRGRGIARRLMDHLHAVAAHRGASQVRLKVYRHNDVALRLYESLEYEFQPWSDSELVGFRAVSPLAAA